MSWQQIAAEKKSHQLDAVPKEWLSSNLPSAETLGVADFPRESNILSALDLEITESSVATLLSNLASSKWSAVQVTTSFYKRAIVAQLLVNCLTEIFVDRALARAKTLDEHLKKTGNVVGPLHGLPISLKDKICMKDIENTMGYRRILLVDILESLGAVPFVKTNIPQTLMWPETFNHIFGRSMTVTCVIELEFKRAQNHKSPQPVTHPGGSTGGEGALIALRGSPLGVGSDVGGSIRLPAGFCGVYGFKPSYHRLPILGACINSMEGQESIVSVLGPLSNSLDGIKTFFKADALTIRKRWSDEEYNLIDHGNGEKLCFAIMWDNGAVVPHPPVRRGLEMCRDALLAAGHQVIDWTPYKQEEIVNTTGGIWSAAAMKDFQTATAPSGEPIIASMSLSQDEDEQPLLFGPSDAVMSSFDLWQLHKRRRELREEHLHHWEDTVGQTGTGRPVDAIISPVAPFVAPPHGYHKNGQYTMNLNMLDYPSMVIPVSQVDQALDVQRPREEFYSKEDRENYEIYDPATYTSAPISVQLICRTMEEEATIALGEILDNALRGERKKEGRCITA
ncbi:general amidase [Mycena galopus ATCC 62051]|nr:general amidase [Mycena galopus ATCC 62051]